MGAPIGFERLYRDHARFVWSAARHCGAPPDAVDDVVQDVFVTVHRRMGELDYQVSPRGWLYGVTRRVAFRYRRSAARTARRRAAYATGAKRADEPHRGHDAARDLEQLLSGLDSDQREAFVMAEVLGMSGPEIASELEIPVNTAYSRIRLARRRLQSSAAAARLDATIEAAKREQPSARQQQRAWAGVIAVTQSPWFGIKAGLVAFGQSLWVPAIAAVAVVSTLIAVGRKPPPPPPPDDEPIPAAVAPPKTPAATKAPAAAAPPRRAAPPGAPDPTPSESPPAGAPPSTPAVTAPPGAPTPPAQTDDLAGEVQLIERARKATESGDARRALVLLSYHADWYPNGQLIDARQAQQVRALCAVGKPDEAAKVRADLVKRFPASNVAKSVPAQCAKPAPASP